MNLHKPFDRKNHFTNSISHFNQSIDQPTNQSINQSINQWTLEKTVELLGKPVYVDRIKYQRRNKISSNQKTINDALLSLFLINLLNVSGNAGDGFANLPAINGNCPFQFQVSTIPTMKTQHEKIFKNKLSQLIYCVHDKSGVQRKRSRNVPIEHIEQSCLAGSTCPWQNTYTHG